MAPSLTRPGYYNCMGCGAPEEVVFMTQDAMQEQWTKTGLGAGHIPEHLMAAAHMIDSGPMKGLAASIYDEPAIEGLKRSRSLKEIEQEEMTEL